MSSIPGTTLEDYIAWNYNFSVEGQEGNNPSLDIAEALGVATNRKYVTQKQFAVLIKDFEVWREDVENWLRDFDEETQSWRDYAYGCPIPIAVFMEASLMTQFMGTEKPSWM